MGTSAIMDYAQLQSESTSIPTIGNDAITILENDHQRVKQLLSLLTDGPQDKRSATLQMLKETLTVHNATEEALVYPAIQELAGRKTHAMKLYHETSEADVMLWQLSMMSPEDSDFEPTAAKVRAAIEKHIETEEETEFAKLRESADSAQQLKLASEVKKFRERFH